MRVLVISGFLGAGKTTFIQELVQRTGKDVVIYENEYGEADVDAQALRADAPDLKVWESVERCICCSGRQDFASSVLTISNTLDPDYLIVEPTGVARLSNVQGNVGSIGYERIGLLPPVCIVDALSWRAQRASARDVFDDQLSCAATVVISKVGERGLDEKDPEAAALLSLVARLNPTATIERRPYAQIPRAWWDALLEDPKAADAGRVRDVGGIVSEGDGPATEFETLSLAHARLPSPSQLIWLLDALSSGVFGHIARAKGTLACGGQWVRFDMVERAWAMTGCDEVEDPACVFIGTQLRRLWLREAFVPALWRDRAEIVHDHPRDGRDHAHDAHDHDR